MNININTPKGQKEINMILNRYNLVNSTMKAVTGQHYKYTFKSHEEILNKVELVKILLCKEGIKGNDLNKAQLTIHSSDRSKSREFEGLTNITGVFDSKGNYLVTRILPVSATSIHDGRIDEHIEGRIFLYSPTMKEFNCAEITRKRNQLDYGQVEAFVEAQMKEVYAKTFSEVNVKLGSAYSLPLLFLDGFSIGGKLDKASNDIQLNVHGNEKLIRAFWSALDEGPISMLTDEHQVDIDMETIAIIMAHHPQPNIVLYAAILEAVRSAGIENEYLKLCRQWASFLI